MFGGLDALRGPTEPHLRFPRHRGEREQRQVPAALLYTGHSTRKLGVVYGQPAGNYTARLITIKHLLNISFQFTFTTLCSRRGKYI